MNKPIKQRDIDDISVSIIFLTKTNHIYCGYYDFELDMWVDKTNDCLFDSEQIEKWNYYTEGKLC